MFLHISINSTIDININFYFEKYAFMLVFPSLFIRFMVLFEGFRYVLRVKGTIHILI